MRTILITGQQGQLSRSLQARSSEAEQLGLQLVAVGRPELDFDQPATIASVVKKVAPALIVNAAAWTAVDQAETEPEAANRANRDAPAMLAELAAARDIPLIHISTDYVFNGAKPTPYVETDPCDPLGEYGRSKRAGECAALAAHRKTIILRTAWLYSPYGKNFARSILAAARTRPRLTVVADQYGCPTEAGMLADAVLSIAAQALNEWKPEFAGVFHAVSHGDASWRNFAAALIEESGKHGGAIIPVDPISTADWPTPTRRPENSRLAVEKIERVFGWRSRGWREDLRCVMPDLMRSL